MALDHDTDKTLQAACRQSRLRLGLRGTSPLHASLVALLTLLLMFSCQNPDPVAKEKQRLLTQDERYLIDYYMKIIEVEKSLHDNPALQEEKRTELDREIDKERIRRTLAALEKKPERWLAIYNRLNELQVRALQKASSERY
jgi:hypothetical protein